MNGREKIEQAIAIMDVALYSKVITKSIDLEDPRLFLKMRDGRRVYIQYNDVGNYSYSIIYSEGILDRIRYDNYDDRWEVPSKPHHIHPRGTKNAIQSEMTGEPSRDMVMLAELLQE